MSRSILLGLIGAALLTASSAHASNAPTENLLIYDTPPGFHWPGPFQEGDDGVLYQQPPGSFVWNGRYYVYREPQAAYPRGTLIRRSY
jgi:hypothetical protein